MKKLFFPRYIIYNLLLFIVNISVISCTDKENNDTIFKVEPTKAESTIDFNLIDCLNESNKKTISLATITFYQTKDVKTLQLLLKIKKDHQKIDSELKRLTENNLIIVPKLSYHFNINSDSLKGKNPNLYLLKALRTEIKNQTAIFKNIENTSQNIDFKIFAKNSKKTIQSNNAALENTLSI
ncbi:hypothetical protein [Flavobacterium granuli]|uniref:DUF4142 domain-containing protein n=1 Tax=Flavobacterium granuli TaxID=280093 RepID=A0ABU1RY90_9FLAO|nr:hypothetical protein [Flavobacterium granuli]MDR6843726.1 hypothetical protein [Flavobacterium granuli]